MIKVLQRCMPDEAIALVGTCSAVCYFVTEAFASTTLHLYLGKCSSCNPFVLYLYVSPSILVKTITFAITLES